MPDTGPVGVGLIGAGMISDQYLDQLSRFPDVHVLIVGDLDPDRAAARALAHHVPDSGRPEDVLAHPEVELVVNLTIPAVHAEVSAAAVRAGKHVWSEKPLSIDRDSGRALLAAAEDAGVLVGVAPDTVLGPGMQSARRAIARGDIGEPLSAQTVMQYAGPDIFHPDPEFLFSPGAGPLFDVGPYYLTALVHLFGPVAQVAGMGSQGRGRRSVQVGQRAGTTFSVDVPTHVSALMKFTGGGVSQSVLSFDSPLTRMGVVEVTGTEGTIVIPDPNMFTGELRITRAPTTYEALLDGPTWQALPVSGVLAGRGVGALDMARCVRSGGRPLASGALGYHVLDTMVAIDEAVRTGESQTVASTVETPSLLPEAWDPFAATL